MSVSRFSNSLRKIYDGIFVMQGKLKHLGLKYFPTKTVDKKGLCAESNKFLKDFFIIISKKLNIIFIYL